MSSNKYVTKDDLQEFYDRITPYLGAIREFDYSTTEKAVGTWHDGRTIYQRSFYYTNKTLTYASNTNFQSLSGITFSEIVDITGIAKLSSGNMHTFPYADGKHYGTIGYNSSVNSLAWWANFDITNAPKITITIKYVKSS